MKKLSVFLCTILLLFGWLVLTTESADAKLAGYTAEGREGMEPWEERISDYVAKAAAHEDAPAEPIPALTYYGNCRITHYCPCTKCCGKCDGITASGAYATEGITVACGGLPFGTQISINGAVYTVQDRGVGNYCIDIFVNDHQRALELGLYYADVYIIG